MARKKVIVNAVEEENVLESVRDGISLNDLNQKVLILEAKTNELTEKIDAVAQKNNALEAKLNSLDEQKGLFSRLFKVNG